jgi:hypothetical protein
MSLSSISDDIGVDLVKLSMLSATVVPAFVPRLGDNKGMLPVRLKLTGARGLPGSADIQVGIISHLFLLCSILPIFLYFPIYLLRTSCLLC